MSVFITAKPLPIKLLLIGIPWIRLELRQAAIRHLRSCDELDHKGPAIEDVAWGHHKPPGERWNAREMGQLALMFDHAFLAGPQQRVGNLALHAFLRMRGLRVFAMDPKTQRVTRPLFPTGNVFDG